MSKPNFQPIIIIGAARSGTNMLRDILSQIPNCGTWDCDEINPIWRHGNLNHPNDEFNAEMARPNVKTFIRKAFEKLSHSLQVDNVIEKSCANSLRVAFINEIFPNAKYIFIYRDGRDTVASAKIRYNASFDLNYTLKKLRYVPPSDLPYYAMTFGKNRLKQITSKNTTLSFWGVQIKNIQEKLRDYSLNEVCAFQWQECVEKSLQDFEKIDDSQVHHIAYEAFVNEPETKLAAILSFLKLDTKDIDLKTLTQKVSKKSIGKFRKQLSLEDQEKINIILKPTLNKLGYKI